MNAQSELEDSSRYNNSSAYARFTHYESRTPYPELLSWQLASYSGKIIGLAKICELTLMASFRSNVIALLLVKKKRAICSNQSE